MKNFFYLLLIAAIAFALCRKEPEYGKLSSEFILSTNYDKTVAFGNYKPYYKADTIGLVFTAPYNA